ALGVADADILRSAIGMMNQTAAMNGSAVVQGLFESVEHKARMGGPAHPPADDTARISIDDEGHIDEARPGADIGEIREPEPVRSRCVEDPVHVVARAWHSPVLHRGADRFAANDAREAEIGHQPLDRATCDSKALAQHLTPDLPRAVDLEIL